MLELLGLILLVGLDARGELLGDFGMCMDVVCVDKNRSGVVGVVLSFLLCLLLILEGLFLFGNLGAKVLLARLGVFSSSV